MSKAPSGSSLALVIAPLLIPPAVSTAGAPVAEVAGSGTFAERDALVRNGVSPENIHMEPTGRKAVHTALRMAEEDDLVLVLSSEIDWCWRVFQNLSARQATSRRPSSLPAALKKARDVLMAAKPKWVSFDYGLTEKMPRGDYNAETALLTMVDILLAHGLPQSITFDRDPRFVGSWSGQDSEID